MSEWEPFLQPLTKYEYRLSAVTSGGKTTQGNIQSFTTQAAPPPPAPTVATEAATEITSSGATLNGTVNPNGSSTTYEFKYGTKSGELNKSTGAVGAGSGSSSKTVSTKVVLEPATTYYFRIYATNAGGTKSGSELSFTTSAVPKPTVATQAATEITSNGATLNGTVNPNGSSTTYEFKYGTKSGELTKSTAAVSAGSGSSNKNVSAEVSLEPATTYYFRIYATNAGGTSTGTELSFTTPAALWKIKESLNPGASDSYLYDVSCEPSTSVCTSVGKSISSGVDSPVAQRWNGTSWVAQSPAKKSGTLPTRLFGVDCPSETRCLAAGNYQPAEGGPTLVTEIWNEGNWNVQSPPVPAESTSSELVAIGCSSTASCTAVGSAMIGGVKNAVAERWTSPNWALSAVPIPEGAKSSQLDGVDCIWSNFCVAVGRYTDSGGSVKHLVMFWNAGWSLQTATAPGEAVESFLHDVSCTPTPNRCTAVGGWKNSAGDQFTLAYRFNGASTWTLQSTPNPPGSKTSVFEDVSCATETSCTAVGSWVGSGSTKTLATAWNGTTWSLQSPPNPAGATYSSLFGVSCRSTSCMGVGWSRSSPETDTTLSEFRE